jgi:hypothetical protein
VRAVLVILLVACALVVAACGGSSSKRLSRSEFVSKGNAVCAKYNDKLKALAQPRNAKEFADLVHNGKALIKQEIAELRKLKPPAAQQSTFDDMLVGAEDGLPILDQMETAARSGDLRQAQQLDSKLGVKDSQVNGVARRLGLTTCAARA